jgi:DNA polymerase-3 subunit alpha
MTDSAQTGVPFVHLRVHSAYSLLEGALGIKALAKLCRQYDMPALALTDTDNMFGALEFSETLAKAGIQPIIGISLAVDFEEPVQAGAATQPDTAQSAGRLALLAASETGYANLMKLSSEAFLAAAELGGPLARLSRVGELSAGLIALTGGPDGPIDPALADGQTPLALDRLTRLVEIFADRLYVELQRHDDAREQAAETGLIDLAYQMNLPLVATNEPYFSTPDEFEAHDALICIAEGNVVNEIDRRRLTPNHYFKSSSDMAALFADLPEAVANTVEIAQRCHFRPHTRAPILPRFTGGEAGNGGFDEAAELTRQAQQGLEARLAALPANHPIAHDEYRKRLEFELSVITKMAYAGYFLIVADFIKWAKARTIPVGPGRGSGAGSVVAWALTVTDLDPLRFGLLFERFLNPERVSMPDFDIDFCQDRRDEVIAYVQERYGRDKVAQIITFGKLQARAVLRDVGRVLQLPYGQVDRLCKLIPNNPASPTTLPQALASEPRLAEARDGDERVAAMLDIGVKLEGLYRHASTHAAGVVIGDRPLSDLIPLYRDPRSDMPVTQFSMKWVEQAGLVKFDFLGLKTLSVLQTAVTLLKRGGRELDIDNLPFDDEKTYQLMSSGDTVGIFQLESSGMRDVLRKLKPDRFEDIIALVALYRPGPMDNIPTFISTKQGLEKPNYLHPWLEPILTETYGVIIYQEQVMEIAQVLSGYTLGEADLLRRAMGKKIQAEMDQQKARFIEGAVEKGVERGRAEYIFELVDKFAGYGFNKSHAAAYALVAYQTAYMKANHPVEFMAASMTYDMANTDKLYLFRQEADRLELELEGPSVNGSGVDFDVRSGRITYALAALKNVGRAAVEHLTEIRQTGGPFLNLADFARRISPRVINKRALESLARAGAFDELNDNRAQVLAGVEAILAFANAQADEKSSGQSNLFGAEGFSDTRLPLPAREAWLPMDRLAEEFEAVGFFLSGHPLDDYQKPLRQMGVTPWQEFQTKVKNGSTAGKLAGTVTYRQERKSRNGNRYAFVGFSDPTGQFEAVVFADTLANSRELLEPGTAVQLGVEAEWNGSETRIRVRTVSALDDAVLKVETGIRIFVRNPDPLPSIAKRLDKGGKAPVHLILLTEGGQREVELDLGSDYAMSPRVKSALKAIDGVWDVQEFA